MSEGHTQHLRKVLKQSSRPCTIAEARKSVDSMLAACSTILAHHQSDNLHKVSQALEDLAAIADGKTPQPRQQAAGPFLLQPSLLGSGGLDTDATPGWWGADGIGNDAAQVSFAARVFPARGSTSSAHVPVLATPVFDVMCYAGGYTWLWSAATRNTSRPRRGPWHGRRRHHSQEEKKEQRGRASRRRRRTASSQRHRRTEPDNFSWREKEANGRSRHTEAFEEAKSGCTARERRAGHHTSPC